MLKELIQFYQNLIEASKSAVDENMNKYFMSDQWGSFSKIFVNYLLDAKDNTSGYMEKVLDFYRLSSKKDMDEIGTDIADIRRRLRELNDKLDHISSKKLS
jgi:polyhydroxyalkanoate synthesis regulator phasin